MGDDHKAQFYNDLYRNCVSTITQCQEHDATGLAAPPSQGAFGQKRQRKSYLMSKVHVKYLGTFFTKVYQSVTEVRGYPISTI